MGWDGMGQARGIFKLAMYLSLWRYKEGDGMGDIRRIWGIDCMPYIRMYVLSS